MDDRDEVDGAEERDGSDERTDAAAFDEAVREVVPDRPEADVLEQSQIVDEQRVQLHTEEPDEADEGDWEEQSIVEPIPSDER